MVELASALGLAGDREQQRKRIYEMERGVRAVSGPTAVAIEAFIEGFRPAHFPGEK